MQGAGVGLKAEHLEPALAASASGLWFEVHAENHLVEGGPRLASLEAVRARHPVSLHGVSASLAGVEPLDALHLARLAALVRRIEPCLVSEHLAWSVGGGRYLPDLLPFPRTEAALQRVCGNVSRLQDAIGRRVAIENPSHYLAFPDAAHDRDEIDFLGELVRRTGCGLLLDLNNVHVSARNLGFEPRPWLDRFPLDAVMELHLAGHSLDPALGAALLVDSHDAPVDESVWALLDHVLARTGPVPTLVERDGNLPPWTELEAERQRADAALGRAGRAARDGDSAPSLIRPLRAGAPQTVIASPAEDAFQRCFVATLGEPAARAEADPLVAALAGQAAIAVYRNTVAKGAIDALEANHPAIVRLVGRDWFRSAAARFAAGSPPRDARLVHYGAGFGAFLGALESTAELPYLAGVARIERAWTEAHVAAAAEPLDASALASIPEAELPGARLALHPATRWVEDPLHPAFTIWSRNRADPADGEPADDAAPDDIAWHGEAALLTRPEHVVRATPLGPGAVAFLAACGDGATLGDAAEAAHTAESDGDLADMLRLLLVAGAFRGPVERQPSTSTEAAPTP